ncbi:squalene synthase HpnC [Paramagnetospirillum magneticum]|uniref:Phytoene/squalene synthetase n=1 Tax=Paramagnetospirillum magneticum (strain ATCC 700264 / AMB-1) TaxID=342108 RepID=Q2W4B2_PARM1|nr:squalene synthase HpnC [Paramagnetospirillum magneticum]BAE51313.1 Phytoene/squalene synthetase [Paramagnetospirillum magneticum AMB-1]
MSLPAASKTAAQENFPVASLLLPKSKRATIMAYYHFARHADDIGDSPSLTSEEKVAGLDALDRALRGTESGPALVLAEEYRRAVDGDAAMIEHASQLLHAFRRDSVRDYCADWADLMEYCRYSAAPVGRFLLDLSGESHDTFAPSDALCAALQVLNHVQDCGKDYHELKRVYIPRDWLAAQGLSIEVLAGTSSPAALRHVLDQMLDATDGLITLAQPLAGRVKDLRMRLQSAITVRVAERLSAKLRRGDPLAGRVKLGKLDYAGVFLVGLWRGLTA